MAISRYRGPIEARLVRAFLFPLFSHGSACFRLYGSQFST